MADIKVFNKWDIKGIEVKDPGLVNYITLKPRMVPKTGAKYAGNRFHKSKILIVERLINKVMVPGHKAKKHFKTSYHCTGKSHKAYHIVKEAFEIIENRTKQNPIKVLVRAIENAAMREEILSIEYGGARYPKPVECAPQRRVDLALRLMVQGSYQTSFNSRIPIEQALANEIINAYNLSNQSFALKKKLETERQCDASR